MECIITIFANLPSGAKHTFAISSNTTLADFRRTLVEVAGQTPAGSKDSFRLHNHDGVVEHDVLLDSSTANLVDAGISNESTITILRQGNSRTFLRVFIYASPPIWLIKSARLMFCLHVHRTNGSSVSALPCCLRFKRGCCVSNSVLRPFALQELFFDRVLVLRRKN